VRSLNGLIVTAIAANQHPTDRLTVRRAGFSSPHCSSSVSNRRVHVSDAAGDTMKFKVGFLIIFISPNTLYMVETYILAVFICVE